MTTKVILVGSGDYNRWPDLKKVPRLLRRVGAWAEDVWPGAEVIDDGTRDPWTTQALRDEIPKWLAGPAVDDVLLVWAGHGFLRGRHWLTAYDTPALDDDAAIGPQNALRTDDLTHWLADCGARRMVVVLDTCWSGDGTHEIAATMRQYTARMLPRRTSRAIEIISAARREEATEGAFLTAMLGLLEGHPSPSGLAEEHRWAPGSRAITVAQLGAAADVELEASDHQTEQDGVNNVGAFFPFRSARQEVEALPATEARQLEGHFPDGFIPGAGPWTAERLVAEAARLGPSDLEQALAVQMNQMAAALSALQFLEGWIGTTGLHVGLEPAWRASLPNGSQRRPTTRYGYVEAVARFGTDERRLVEFVARVIAAAGEEPNDDRLFAWAERTLQVNDLLVVDEAMRRAAANQRPGRLIVDFGMHIEADGDDNARPEIVTGCLHLDGGGMESHTVPYVKPDGVATAVGELVRWAIDRAPHGLDHVDLVIPIGLVPHATPEHARYRRRHGPPEIVFLRRSLTLHWDERLRQASLANTEVVSLARDIEKMTQPIRWFDPAKVADNDAFALSLDAGPKGAIAFTSRPEDLDLFYYALYKTPYVLWVDDTASCADRAQLEAEAHRRWDDFPHCLLDERRPGLLSDGPPTSQLATMRAIWDDGDWLEQLVPLMAQADHRAQLGT